MKSLPKTRQIIHPVNNWANFSAKSIFDSNGKLSKSWEIVKKRSNWRKTNFLIKITYFIAVYRAIDIENANLSVVQICLIILSLIPMSRQWGFYCWPGIIPPFFEHVHFQKWGKRDWKRMEGGKRTEPRIFKIIVVGDSNVGKVKSGLGNLSTKNRLIDRFSG